MLIRAALSRSIICLLLSMGATGVSASSIEVMHFWTHPGEVAALEVFADAFRRQGGDWSDVGQGNRSQMRQRAIERIVLGFPPTAVQWHAGSEIGELLSIGIIRPVDAVTDVAPIRARLHPAVNAAMTYKGQMEAVPVGIHGNNWAWYNSDIYRRLGLGLPGSWAEFLDQAPAIQATGMAPLALGAWDWELVLLFNTVLVDVAGKSKFLDQLRQVRPGPDDRARISDAIRTFRALKPFSVTNRVTPENWVDAANRVMRGEAAMQVMGDWAKGTFLAAGKQPGLDFECRLAPGNSDALMLVLDVFMLARSDDPAVAEAQRAFVDTVLDAENQAAFSRVKGALPVVRDADPTGMDQCALLGLEKLEAPDSTIPSLVMGAPQEFGAILEATVVEIWADDTLTDEQATDLYLSRMAR